MDSLFINKKLIDEMLAHAKEASPSEACGILAGKENKVEKIYRMKNIEASPVSYEMDSKEQFSVMKEMEKNRMRMVAIYHSHPHGGAYPSPKDIKLAFYPDTAYIIVGLGGDEPEVRAYLMEEGKEREIGIIAV
jgi:proteasome lid subunit RPN8/RPN11